jgi:hypothetical protein
MATIMITRRRTKSGPRHVVRFRLGGRAFPLIHAGSFRTLKEAKARRDLVAGEIAYGRNPADALAQLTHVDTRPVATLSAWGERWLASRIEVDVNTVKNNRPCLKVICETFGDRDPSTIATVEIAEWIAEMRERARSRARSASTGSLFGSSSTMPESSRIPPAIPG